MTAMSPNSGMATLETGNKQPEAIALYLSAGYTEVPGFGYYRDSASSRYFGRELTS